MTVDGMLLFGIGNQKANRIASDTVRVAEAAVGTP
jgi:hypothetical protein